MLYKKTDIITKLQREILSLGGISSTAQDMDIRGGLDFLAGHFPQGRFPMGAMHEFIGAAHEEMAASSGFISALISACLPVHGAVAWISREATVFPPALNSYRVEPHHIIFIHPANEKDLLWTTEEALKCAGLSAVIVELQDLQFRHSRRFQLAVEKSRVTGFILNQTRGNPTTNSCVSRWKIKSLPSETEKGLPGVGHPHWEIELQKIRNGRPGCWPVHWSGEKFQLLQQPAAPLHGEDHHKLTG